MHDQLPGLASKGFQPTGKYGIGFFSVFMWGERVEVTTRRFDRGRSDTIVLSFKQGLRERPLLRQASDEEHIPDGGTRVKVWFTDERTLERLCWTYGNEWKLTVAEVCAQIAPCLDVNLSVDGETAVVANDWLTIESEHLLNRIAPRERYQPKGANPSYWDKKPFPPLPTLAPATGSPLGRAAIWGWAGYYSQDGRGIVTVGGLRACALGGIVGVFVGSPRKATRDWALPLVPRDLLEGWAKAELDARKREGHPAEALSSIAPIAAALDVLPSGLPIAEAASGWVTPEEIQQLARSMNEVFFVSPYAFRVAGGQIAVPKLHCGVFAVDDGRMEAVVPGNNGWVEWPDRVSGHLHRERKCDSRSLAGVVIECLAHGWGVSVEAVLAASSFGSDEEVFRREVGTLAGNPYVEEVDVIRRP